MGWYLYKTDKETTNKLTRTTIAFFLIFSFAGLALDKGCKKSKSTDGSIQQKKVNDKTSQSVGR